MEKIKSSSAWMWKTSVNLQSKWSKGVEHSQNFDWSQIRAGSRNLRHQFQLGKSHQSLSSSWFLMIESKSWKEAAWWPPSTDCLPLTLVHPFIRRHQLCNFKVGMKDRNIWEDKKKSEEFKPVWDRQSTAMTADHRIWIISRFLIEIWSLITWIGWFFTTLMTLLMINQRPDFPSLSWWELQSRSGRQVYSQSKPAVLFPGPHWWATKADCGQFPSCLTLTTWHTDTVELWADTWCNFLHKNLFKNCEH